MKILSVGAYFLRVDGRTDGQRDRHDKVDSPYS